MRWYVVWVLGVCLVLSGCGGGSGSGGSGNPVFGNQDPVARFTVTSQSLSVPATVAFNGSASSDSDGTVEAYSWDFGDGNTANGAVVSNIYADAGSYTVTLTVTDDDGATDSHTEVVNVLNQQPAVPVIDTAAPHLIAPATVQFDATGSTDPDGDIASYHWDFDDNGSFGQGPQVSHVFEQPGDYEVVLTLTDDTGLLSSDSVVITVLPRSAGQYSISGRVRATEQTYVDGDTNDPLSTLVANNSGPEAQVIGNPSITGGFVAQAPTGGTQNGDRFANSSDVSDFYRVNLQAGQRVLLEIGDWANGDVDIDLFLYNDLGTQLDFSEGVSDVEVVEAPLSGTYWVEVFAYSGFSNYELSVGVSAARIPARAWAMGSRSPIVENELLVRMAGDGVLTPAQANTRAAGLKLAGEPRAGRLARMALSEPPVLRALTAGFNRPTAHAGKQATLRALKQLRRDPAVAEVAPNYWMTPQATIPTDPSYIQQWHYPQINLPQAWDHATGAGVIVAVLDTGVYLAHEDLGANLVSGYDFISSSANAADGNGIDNNPDDPGDGGLSGNSSWHGTHVAGTVAAVANNGRGGVGVAYGARIMPIRVLGTQGGSSYDILQGLRYAARLPNDSGTVPPVAAKIANLSLGCQFCFSASEAQAYQAVRDAGVILIAAAGNENSTAPGYPASYDAVVSVSATDRFDARAPYSNQSQFVAIAAPGGNQRTGASSGILSTLVDQSSGQRRSAYAWYQGTSMASPHVAGVAALMAEIYPSLTPAEFDQAISSGGITVDVGPSGRDDSFGYGRVDAYKAVQYALALAGNTLPASLAVNPGSVAMGAIQNAATVQVNKTGNGALQVISVFETADWLTVNPDTVDGDGFGSYQLLVDRTGLADGSYQTTVTFTDSNGATAEVLVSMTQGVQTSDNGVGVIYLLLLDENFNFFDQAVLYPSVDPGDEGDYIYSFTQLPSGKFYLVAGTDNDNDLELCDAGEVCGAYPTLGVLTPVQINDDLTDADFLILIGDAVSSAAQTNPEENNRIRITRK
ncbi:S8 family serine peptidase [Simiduia agarivorans]|uniref:Peptidase S8/S53 subtilisin kexin sedolisin n=1 Tax=Simiduia agarivorans (strain DSM 21679 / JCM 13881 / BCRC 17597 / SA1) TaxID=1117647 RepID=K4KNR0_SIMAS|nr:S8 family serine peptidase [Simiduia agarivorans]AFU99880.1 peptidase S8/S53 subtilisin kexin sedolisin [Simiduia agarivorans SA1 = DSM 21679]